MRSTVAGTTAKLMVRAVHLYFKAHRIKGRYTLMKNLETGFSDSGFRFLPLMKRVMSTGTMVMARMEEAAMAKVFVKARGLNILPSWASSKNTGMKEMMMIIKEKKIALPTCLAAWMTVLVLSLLSSSVPSDSFR